MVPWGVVPMQCAVHSVRLPSARPAVRVSSSSHPPPAFATGGRGELRITSLDEASAGGPQHGACQQRRVACDGCGASGTVRVHVWTTDGCRRHVCGRCGAWCVAARTASVCVQRHSWPAVCLNLHLCLWDVLAVCSWPVTISVAGKHALQSLTGAREAQMSWKGTSGGRCVHCNQHMRSPEQVRPPSVAYLSPCPFGSGVPIN